MTASGRIAFITGVTGQDGSYLAELLIDKGYVVHGMVRRSSTCNTSRIDHLIRDRHEKDLRFYFHFGEMTSTSSLVKLLAQIQPDEIYNLAAQSHVRVSFDVPEYTSNCTGVGALRLLEAIRICNLQRRVRVYQASSSEMYGNNSMNRKINEETNFSPRSPYGVAKLFAHHTMINYRDAYGIYTCNGILFNHESPRRGITFVTRKITKAVATIKLNPSSDSSDSTCLFLGNLEAKRDWGHARDYVQAMWLMLQQEEPQDLIIATGETHSVREFVEIAFKCVNINIQWQGKGANEVGIHNETGKILVRIDPSYYRPTEIHCLWGDYSQAAEKLGWTPKISFSDLIKEMIVSDLKGAALGRVN